MKLIIAGGRGYVLTELDYNALDRIPDVTEVVNGGATGADALAIFPGGAGSANMHRIAKKMGLVIYDFSEPKRRVEK